ncbi:uncharacterized protein TNCV_4652611 [Trichonephila clavipes]|nr:uncharacterized protein TNCV_4652611 [Trichonephila clavipes]
MCSLNLQFTVNESFDVTQRQRRVMRDPALASLSAFSFLEMLQWLMTLQLDVTSEPGSFSTHQVLPTTRPVLSPVPPNYVLTPLAYGTAENAPPPNTLRDTAVLQPQAPLTYQSTTSVKYSIEGPIVSEVARDVENPVSNTNQNKGESSAPMETTNVEINRILARIEQDNRILAELEKSRATVAVHDTMDTQGEEVPVLVVEPIFNSNLYLIIDEKWSFLQSFLE